MCLSIFGKARRRYELKAEWPECMVGVKSAAQSGSLEVGAVQRWFRPVPPAAGEEPSKRRHGTNTPTCLARETDNWRKLTGQQHYHTLLKKKKTANGLVKCFEALSHLKLYY